MNNWRVRKTERAAGMSIVKFQQQEKHTMQVSMEYSSHCKKSMQRDRQKNSLSYNLKQRTFSVFFQKPKSNTKRPMFRACQYVHRCIWSVLYHRPCSAVSSCAVCRGLYLFLIKEKGLSQQHVSPFQVLNNIRCLAFLHVNEQTLKHKSRDTSAESLFLPAL